MALRQSPPATPAPKTVALGDGSSSDADEIHTLLPNIPGNSGSGADSVISPSLPTHKPGDENHPSPDNSFLEQNPFKPTYSSAENEWAQRKAIGGEQNDVLDALMKYVGLESVKQQFLDIKSKVDICKEQGRGLASENFSIVFQGNPGTGKTTVAGLYGQFLESLNVFEIDSWNQEALSGIEIVNGGHSKIEETIEEMTGPGEGGVLIIDEAYQLISPQAGLVGKSAIDTILAMMQKHSSSLAIVFLGYKEEMEDLFKHNLGIISRIPYTMDFDDFTEHELWNILHKMIVHEQGEKMEVEGGMSGLYMRCIIRRLSAGRGKNGFGNARTVQNLLRYIMQRQARRIVQEKRHGITPNCYRLTKEDLLGPDPSTAVATSPAWRELQDLVGLEQVKSSVKGLIDTISNNYRRELHDLRPIAFSLNQVFVGEPGTGKTTVAGLYGKILAELGFLSRGDVIFKTAADFIGDCLGKSETQTRKILNASLGKVLIIDEAYMLDPGSSYGDHDKFKTGVLDTIVSMVQGQPFEDRCIIFVGYETKISTMFRNANPGLSRRFPCDKPFRFSNFTIDQMAAILRSKLKNQDLDCSDSAMIAACELFKKGTRGTHTNAGVVDKTLEAAKMNYSKRISKAPFDPENPNPKLEAADFNLDLINTTRANYCEQMRGRIDGAIIHQLEGYQKRHWKAKELGINSDDLQLVPTRFVFYGPPGTGKTTTAHAMAHLFFEIGYLSMPEVVEYAATDLVAQFVGQTGHKTREKLREAIGRLVVIDASRFLKGAYEAEAVNELTHFLSEPAHQRNMVVVLVGDRNGLDKLMGLPAVSSVFSEEIIFNHIPPEDCIALLGRELASTNIVDSASFKFNPESPMHIKMKQIFSSMQSNSSWGNARDVKHLAREILGKLFELECIEGAELEKHFSTLVVSCIDKRARRGRQRHNKTAPRRRDPVESPIFESKKASAAPVSIKYNSNDELEHRSNKDLKAEVEIAHARTEMHERQVQRQGRAAEEGTATREDDVSDADWERVQKARKTAIEEKRRFGDLGRQLAKARERLSGAEGADEELRQQEYDTIEEEYMKARTLLQKQEKIQEALQKMGRCVYGFTWRPDGAGYTCEGGSHHVTDVEIHRMAGL
ncbi:P-loop containing nucleoside triphosphate hydrolase protein [Nemania sp. FL0916]|nr:P-loop containing nucleoside triphosphate hydrolase protein [Nemania sp. FL0916]